MHAHRRAAAPCRQLRKGCPDFGGHAAAAMWRALMSLLALGPVAAAGCSAPAGELSITAYGAVAGVNTTRAAVANTHAINKTLAAALAHGPGCTVVVPAGRFLAFGGITSTVRSHPMQQCCPPPAAWRRSCRKRHQCRTCHRCRRLTRRRTNNKPQGLMDTVIRIDGMLAAEFSTTLWPGCPDRCASFLQFTSVSLSQQLQVASLVVPAATAVTLATVLPPTGQESHHHLEHPLAAAIPGMHMRGAIPAFPTVYKHVALTATVVAVGVVGVDVGVVGGDGCCWCWYCCCCDGVVVVVVVVGGAGGPEHGTARLGANPLAAAERGHRRAGRQMVGLEAA